MAQIAIEPVAGQAEPGPSGGEPSQQVVGIVYQELVNLMGPVDHSLHLKGANDVTVLMMCGLQGSGKTTTTGKLGRMLKARGRRPLLVACDLQRPAAIDQLHVLGQQLAMRVLAGQGIDVRAVRYDAANEVWLAGAWQGTPQQLCGTILPYLADGLDAFVVHCDGANTRQRGLPPNALQGRGS